MAAVELLEVSRSIRSAMGDSAGQFKQAAAASNANLSKIVKDIATTFASQRKDITDLHNTISESQYTTEQTNEKIDGLTRVFQETVSIQTSMLGELKSISRNIKILNDNTESMNRNLSNNLVGQGGNSILNSLTTGFSSVATALGAAAVGGAVGYVAGGAGGTGGSLSPAVPFTGPNKPILDTIKERESGGNYQAHAKTSSASGAYQFTTGTWQTMTRKFGIGTEYPTAASAPPQIQDKVADAYVSDILKRAGGDVSKVPLEWFTGNLAGKMSAQQQAANPGVTAESYQAAFMKALAKHGGPTAAGATAAATTNQTTTPEVTPTNRPPDDVPSATAPRAESMIKEDSHGHHGPVSGAAHAEKVETSASLPSGDLVALGNALKGMKVQISEHPAFGGVSPTAHGKNSAHYDGNAIDINAPGGIVEAQDPIWGARFDELAKQIQAAGYTVLWRTKGHQDHIHAQLGGKGIKGGASIIGGQVTPSTGATPTTPGSSAPQMTATTPGMAATTPTAAPTPSSAEPVSQAPVSQATMGPQMSGFPMGQLMGMMGGMLPMGLGGILGSVLPMIGSALQGLESSPLPFAELAPQPTVANKNIQRVKEAAIESQAIPDLTAPTSTAVNTPTTQSGTGPMSPADASGYAYNLPGDVGWPDWAALIGGNHWEEMKNYKKNMSWG